MLNAPAPSTAPVPATAPPQPAWVYSLTVEPPGAVPSTDGVNTFDGDKGVVPTRLGAATQVGQPGSASTWGVPATHTSSWQT